MQKLTPNQCYHIFNHANGFENLFVDEENYRFFLEKYKKHISPIAETYAYCLLPNHFHLVIRIRQQEVIEALMRKENKSNYSDSSINFSKVSNFGKVNTGIGIEKIEYFLSKQFANLFSCYTQSFNKVNNRRGSLFLKNFKREPIDNKEYFFNTIIYTHRNPIHHAFCSNYGDWSYTSFCEITENKSQIIETDKLIRMFGDTNNFIDQHEQSAEKFKESLMADL